MFSPMSSLPPLRRMLRCKRSQPSLSTEALAAAQEPLPRAGRSSGRASEVRPSEQEGGGHDGHMRGLLRDAGGSRPAAVWPLVLPGVYGAAAREEGESVVPVMPYAAAAGCGAAVRLGLSGVSQDLACGGLGEDVADADIGAAERDGWRDLDAGGGDGPGER